jgi:hypothetical protein
MWSQRRRSAEPRVSHGVITIEPHSLTRIRGAASAIMLEVRLFDDDPRRGDVSSGDLLPDTGGYAAVDEGVRIIGFGNGDPGSGVGGFADLEVERCRAVRPLDWRPHD